MELYGFGVNRIFAVRIRAIFLASGKTIAELAAKTGIESDVLKTCLFDYAVWDHAHLGLVEDALGMDVPALKRTYSLRPMPSEMGTERLKAWVAEHYGPELPADAIITEFLDSPLGAHTPDYEWMKFTALCDSRAMRDALNPKTGDSK
jgi:hypothetical protein